MKKIIVLSLITLCLTGCGNNNTETVHNTMINNPSTMTEDTINKQINALQDYQNTYNVSEDVVVEDVPVYDTSAFIDSSSENLPIAPNYDVEIDISAMNANITYATVYDMMSYPDNYEGKVIKIKGLNTNYTDTVTGNTYHTIIIQDAMACCQQGIEYVLIDNPDETLYPAENAEVTIIGTFTTYTEEHDGQLFMYIRLANAEIEAVG